MAEGEFQRVAEAFRCQQGRAGATSLDDGIGGEGRSVDDQVDILRVNAGFRQHFGNAVEDAFFRGLAGRQDFARDIGRRALQHHVGERAANIDCQAIPGHSSFLPERATRVAVLHNRSVTA